MGIPVDLLPFTSDDMVKTENHRKWLEFRKRQEQKQQQEQQLQPPYETTATGCGSLPATDSATMDVHRNGDDSPMDKGP